MVRLLVLALLVSASALTVTSQSGRRGTAPRSTSVAPIQPPANPEPEAPKPPAVAPPSRVSFLPERVREREIAALGNGSFRFADFQGKVLVINLWASWCGPCRREVPEYEKVRQGFAGQEVEFIGLTTEDPRTASGRVNKFVRDVGFTFRLGWADSEVTRTLMGGQTGIPQTLVIDSGGRVVDHWTGYRPGYSGDKLKMTIDHALQVASRL